MRQHNDHQLDQQTRQWMQQTGLDQPAADFTQRVMQGVALNKKLSPLKDKRSNIWNILLAVIVPAAYFFYRYMSGAPLVPGGINLQTEIQPYINIFQLLFSKITVDFSAPIVPLGILAIITLLIFDRLIIRSLSLHK